MSDPLSGLLAALDLHDTGARTTEDLFTGISHPMPHGRVFGGQVFAQAVIAAQRTVGADRNAHSAHGYFLRPGDVDVPITFAVDRLFDGRSFSTRRSQAFQNGVPILSMITSFQDLDPGFDHQVDMPDDLPQPEELAPSRAGTEHVADPEASWLRDRPFELRHVDPPIYLDFQGERRAHQAVWLRSTGPLPDDPHLHRAALAYASDFGTIEPIMRKHGASWSTPGLKTASLDHAIWWHRPVRVDEWMLFVLEGTNAIGGRGLTHGRFYSRDGVLLASIAQEGMLRVPVA
jgi:acyl-CoA thioesterase-2